MKIVSENLFSGKTYFYTIASRRVDAEIAAAVSSSSGRADSLFEAFPLLGIPFTAKDCFNVKGLSWEDCQMTYLIGSGGNFSRRTKIIIFHIQSASKMLFLSCVNPPLAAGRVHANYKVRRLVGYLFSVGV